MDNITLLAKGISPYDPLGDLDFTKMIPEAARISAIIFLIIVGILGLGAAFKAKEHKRAVAIVILTICILILGEIVIINFIPFYK